MDCMMHFVASTEASGKFHSDINPHSLMKTDEFFGQSDLRIRLDLIRSD